jgi:hypothetical protein
MWITYLCGFVQPGDYGKSNSQRNYSTYLSSSALDRQSDVRDNIIVGIVCVKHVMSVHRTIYASKSH